MLPLGVMLLSLAAPPSGLVPPVLAVGDELVYQGEIHEVSERIELPYRRYKSLEVRLFALAKDDAGLVLAVLTQIQAQDDPHVATAVKVVTGRSVVDSPPAVSLDLIRVDRRGRLRTLHPGAGPPLAITERTLAKPLTPDPLNAPPSRELGMFVPLPEDLPSAGESWAIDDPGRPATSWRVNPPAIWNGAQVVELSGVQQSIDWESPLPGRDVWRRTERIWTSPVDGLARVVHRQIEQKEGSTRTGFVAIRYEMQPPIPHRGESYQQLRKEIEQAYAFGVNLEPLLPRALEVGPKPFEAILARIQRYKQTQSKTNFRSAIEAVQRRCEAGMRGEVPAEYAVPQAGNAAVPTTGQAAPDCIARQVSGKGSFRLSQTGGKVRVLIFYKPDSSTSRGALAIAEALHEQYHEQATVVPLAILVEPEQAGAQADKLSLSVPVYDGRSAQSIYALKTFPRIYLVDPQGTIRWDFEGYGPEVGYLLKTELEKLVK